MDLITMENLREISTIRSPWCVSLFMPTHRAGREMEQDPIRFKNLLRKAEEQLLASGLRSPEVQKILKKPQRLLQDKDFWQRQSDGLALFFTEDLFQYFRLPVEFAETTVLTDRFHVKPLLPILARDSTFYILALSQNQLRLLEGTRHTVDEMDLGDTPESLAATFLDGFPEKQLQSHTSRPSAGGTRSPLFHGHDPSDDTKKHIQQWFRTIDKAVTDLLTGTQSPLVLAGVDNLFPLYREINTYPHLVEKGIPGNPDAMRAEDFLPQAWSIVEPIFNQERKAVLAQYQQLSGTGQTTTDVAAAALAAHHGRIEALFVAVGVQAWGRFDSENNRVDLHETPQPGDEDLLDFTAIQTLLKGGTVFVVHPEEVPEQALVAAVLRH